MVIDFTRISVDQLRRKKQSEQLQLFDVRSAADFARGHIAGSISKPLPDIEDTTCELQIESNQAVYLICQDASKADLAAAALRRRGIPDIYVVAGGLKSWVALGNDLEVDGS